MKGVTQTMARFRQVTRSIQYTEATVMVVDTVSSIVENVSHEVSGTFDNDEKLLKAVQESLDSTHKAVSVISAKVLEKTFCMPETMFIASAMPLPIGKKSLTKADFETFYNEQYDGEDEEE